jgi:hypothetical protein
MITAFIVTVCIPGLILVMALAKLAGDAGNLERKMVPKIFL